MTATNFAWTPVSLQIEVGDTVTFANGGGSHTWVRDDAPDSCALPCTRTFSQPATVSYHCGVHPFMTGTVQVGAPLVVLIDSPAEGASVTGTFPIDGRAITPSGVVSSVTVQLAGGPVIDASIDGETWSASVPTDGLPDGSREIVVRARSSTSLSAEARRTLLVDNPDRIDLLVTTVSGQGAATTSNTIVVGLRNEGNVASGAFVARVEYLYQGEWRLVRDTSVASIPAQAARTITVPWAQGEAGVFVGAFTIRAVADPDALVADVDRGDNARTGTAGWVNGGVAGVDLLDPI